MMSKQLLRMVRDQLIRWPEWEVKSYLRNGRKPWSRGYHLFKERWIQRHLNDSNFLNTLRTSGEFPPHYGEFLDERVVEYPWLFSRLEPTPGRLLDAGSILNYGYLLQHEALRGKDITIVTLAPENHCFWQRGISYLFADLRDLPLRDNWFDEIISISTIEHVGMDNTLIYTPDNKYKENCGRHFLRAVRELRRVCKPGGKVYLTVPFGRYTDFHWYQQFDAAMIDELIATFEPARVRESYYSYQEGGWHRSEKAACAHLEGFDIHATRYMNPVSDRDYDPDHAAASRAIAALELWNGSAT